METETSWQQTFVTAGGCLLFNSSFQFHGKLKMKIGHQFVFFSDPLLFFYKGIFRQVLQIHQFSWVKYGLSLQHDKQMAQSQREEKQSRERQGPITNLFGYVSETMSTQETTSTTDNLISSWRLSAPMEFCSLDCLQNHLGRVISYHHPKMGWGWDQNPTGLSWAGWNAPQAVYYEPSVPPII